MEEQESKTDADDMVQGADKHKWSDHCKTFIIKDAHGTIKELVFPKALDLDRPKRERTVFSSRQLGRLEEEFRKNQYLVGKERTTVAKRLGLSETQVKVWFQNRRTKHKKDNERCGESKDSQAESRAAQNVLKLLEYKTVLGYNSFLSPTAAKLESFTFPQSASIISGTDRGSLQSTDQIVKELPDDFLQAESILDSPAKLNEDLHNKHCIVRAPGDVTPQTRVTNSSLPWAQNDEQRVLAKEDNIGNKLKQPSKSCIIRPSKSPMLGSELLNPSSVLTDTAVLKTADSAPNERLLAEASMENLFRNSNILQEQLICNRKDSPDIQTTVNGGYQYSNDKLKLENLQSHFCAPTREQQGAHTYTSPLSAFTNPRSDISRDSYQYKSQINSPYLTSCTYSSIHSTRSTADRYGRICVDRIPAQDYLPIVCSSSCIQNDFTSSLEPRYLTQTFPDMVLYQSSLPSSCSGCNQATTTYQGSRQPEDVPYLNIPSYNYDTGVYGPKTNEQTKLHPLHYMPLHQTFTEGSKQSSVSTYTQGIASYINHSSIAALSSPYHTYSVSSPRNQVVPD